MPQHEMTISSVSIITATLNNEDVIKDCLASVSSQSYSPIEHLILDGNSHDSTVHIASHFASKPTVVSQSDNGIYDALNKGIAMSTGDVIGILHSDDILNGSRTVETIVDAMDREGADICYGDLVYTRRHNLDQQLRYWKSKPYRSGMLRFGWMPPHPTLFVRKSVYLKYGMFNTQFQISSDYEFVHRIFSIDEIKSVYLPEIIVRMRAGGTSNKNIWNISKKMLEDYQVWRQFPLHERIIAVALKNITKLPQFLKKPPKGTDTK